jgi:hypothetical protein
LERLAEAGEVAYRELSPNNSKEKEMKNKLFMAFFVIIFVSIFSCSTTDFSSFGQIETKTVKSLEGDYTIQQLCIAPRTVRWNMSELWISKAKNRIAFIGSFYNPQRFDKTSIPIAVDGKIYTLTGNTNFDAEVWGYTQGYGGTGGTLYTNTVSVTINDELKSLIKNSNQLKIDLSVPSEERIEILEKP